MYCDVDEVFFILKMAVSAYLGQNDQKEKSKYTFLPILNTSW